MKIVELKVGTNAGMKQSKKKGKVTLILAAPNAENNRDT